jgi:hypothetical protein
MMNGGLVNEEADYLAKRIMREAGESRNAQIERAFELVLSREASSQELAKFAASGKPLESLCRVLLNSNEFIYVE